MSCTCGFELPCPVHGMDDISPSLSPQPGTRGSVEALRAIARLRAWVDPRWIGGSGPSKAEVGHALAEIDRLHAQGEAAAPDVQRLRDQALAISELLREAGIGSCPITEGVRTLINRGEAAAAERDRLMRELQEERDEIRPTAEELTHREVERQLLRRCEQAEADLSAARSRVQEMEPYLQHKLTCATRQFWAARLDIGFDGSKCTCGLSDLSSRGC